MTSRPLEGLRVAVAGAGVLGLSIAALAARRGARVVVFDPAPLGDNASGVAAGMLSPALEMILEGGDRSRHVLFQRAFQAWPAFAAALRAPFGGADCGALHVGDEATLEALAGRLRDLDIDARRLGAVEAHAAQPLYAGDREGLLIAADSRVDPGSALGVLAFALAEQGGRLAAERLAPGGVPDGFDRLVIATGYDARAWAQAAPEVAQLTPIKGHILHYAAAGCGGPTLRAAEGYLAPQATGVAFGATMEAGRSDLALDPAVVAKLQALAVALAPTLEGPPWPARTGVRATTPDGLPMVGASAGGPVLAVGARRNGWLLAPLVAEAAVAALEGAPAWPEFAPGRFSVG